MLVENNRNTGEDLMRTSISAGIGDLPCFTTSIYITSLRKN